jgi:hypothetical protein
MITTPDGVDLYTTEEVQALRDERDNSVQAQFIAGSEFGARCKSNELRGSTIDWFKGEVSEGNMTQDDAKDIFNPLARAIGWEIVTTFNGLFTVSVEYNGETIAEFSDVEADDDDGAVEEIRYNLEIEEVETTFAVSYNGGTTQRSTVDTSSEFDDSELEFTATEQE